MGLMEAARVSDAWTWRTAGLLLLAVTLSGCCDFLSRPAVTPGAQPFWQNAPSNATFEPPNARPR